MSKPLEGVRVLEVAAWTFVPAAGAILADLGADVIKVEPPTGDPQRALKNMLNLDKNGPEPVQRGAQPRQAQHHRRSHQARGPRRACCRSRRTSDVFLTSYLPEARKKLGSMSTTSAPPTRTSSTSDGSGWGSKGPMQDTGGYDLAAGWATSGFAQRLLDSIGDDAPPPQPPAFYDLQGGNTIAGATAMALFKRERTGETSVVDVSLMNVGMWSMCPDLVAAPYMKPTDPRTAHAGQPAHQLVQDRPTAVGSTSCCCRPIGSGASCAT